MRLWILVLVGAGLLGGNLLAQEEGNAKAKRYHSLLLKRPESGTIFERFVSAWLDTGTKEGLVAYLKDSAEKGEAVEWRVLAAYLEYVGKDEDALDALNKAVEKDAKNGPLLIVRAKLHARLLNFEAALKDLESAGPAAKEGDAATLRGLYFARTGQPEKAVEAWKEIMKERPKDEELREDLIELEVAEGLYDEALETVDALLEITKDPYQKALRRLRKGDVLVVAGKRDDALTVFQEVLGSTGDNTWLEREVLAQVERVFVREDDVVGLRKFYTRLREAFPRRVSLRKGLAVQMAANGEIDEAVALFREVLKITPGDRRNREEFIDLLEEVEKLDEAVKELKALMGDKDDPDLLERMAGLYGKNNDKKGVKEVLDKILAIRGTEAFGLVRTARLFERHELKKESEQILRDGLKKFPDTLEVVEALASYLAQEKRKEEAIALWTDIAKTSDREGLLRVARSLMANGLSKEAFTVMHARIDDFAGDVILLTQYCQAATQADQADQAWPQALGLVRNSKSSTALEGAIKVSMGMARRMDVEDLIRELGEAKSIGEQCLLSELYEFTGEDQRALEILAEAEKMDEGLIVASQRVRLLERRGDLEQAAEAMRAVLARPKGRRPVYIRRLVDLLAAAGNLEKALEEVDGWKRVAPGDRIAWNRRAELLKEMGRIDEAVVELRRAATKFGGDDKDMRSNLAAALVEAGNYREGERIYRKLYEEANDAAGKLRWIEAMVNLARQEGRQDELVEDFERRKRANPREVTPLLALALIYEGLNDAGGQQEALIEAIRRRPGDVKLIGDLAKLFETNGDSEKSLKWLKEAAKRDPGPDSARRLAEYYFRNGETEMGLAMLKSIPAEVNNPRALEKTLQSLARSGEWSIMLNYMAGLGEVMQRDWRLRYLHAVTLEEEGQTEEAEAIYHQLLEAEGEIKGVRPLVEMKQFREWTGRSRIQNKSKLDGMIANYQWSQYQSYAYTHVNNRNHYRRSYGRAQSTDIISMPGEIRELRWMSLAHLLKLATAESAEAKSALLKQVQAPWLAAIDLEAYGQKNLVDYYTKKLEANPDDLKILSRAIEQLGSSKDLAAKWLELAADKLEEENPMVSLQARFHLMERKGTKKAEQAEKMMEMAQNIDEQISLWALGWIAQLAYNNTSSGLTKEERDRITDYLLDRVKEADVDFWSNNWWITYLLRHLLTHDRFDEGIALVNRISDGLEKQAKKKGQVATGPAAYQVGYPGGYIGSPYGNQQGALAMPQFPGAQLNKRVPNFFREIFGNNRGRYNAPLTKRQQELLAKLQKNQTQGPAQNIIDREKLAEHISKIKNGFLRVHVWSFCNNKEKAGEELAKLAEEGDSDAIILSAGYAASQEKDLPKAYELLVQARAKPLDRATRTEIDGYLAILGSTLSAKPELKDKVDLEQAKRAVMRLRRSFRAPNQVQQLAQVMGTLGMTSEMERLLNPRSTRVRIGGASQYSRRSYSSRRGAGVTKQLALGNRKAAAMEAVKQLRQAMRDLHNSSYEIRQAVEIIQGGQLADSVLELMNPGETKSVRRRLDYARACNVLQKPKMALPILRQLAEERPEDVNIRAQLASVLPREEREGAMRKLIEKKALDEAGDVVAALFATMKSQEEYFTAIELLTELLEGLEPSGAGDRNLSFAPYHGRRAVEGWNFGNSSFPSLQTALNIPKSQLESKDKKVQEQVKKQKETWNKRVTLANRLLKAMAKHPQLAKVAFQMSHGFRVGLGRKEDDFTEEARAALLTTAKWKDGGQYRNSPWMYYRSDGSGNGSGNPSGLGLDPMTFLMKAAAKNKAGFDEKLLNVVREAEPDREKLIDVLAAMTGADSAKALAAIEAWKKELPSEVYTKQQNVTELCRFVLMLNLEDGAVMKELEKTLLGEPELTRYALQQNQIIFRDLAVWVKARRGVEGINAYFETLTTGLLGKRDTWAAYVELSQAGVLPSNLRQGEYPLENFFEYTVQNKEIALETLAFVSRAGLIPIVDDVRYYYSRGVSQQLQADTPEEVIQRIANAGLWKDDSLATWGATFSNRADRGATFYASVLSNFRFQGADANEKKKKLGSILKADDSENRLLKRMVGAYLHNEGDGKELVIEELRRDAERLKGLPDDQVGGLSAMVRYWLPNFVVDDPDEHTAELLEKFTGGNAGGQIAQAKAWLENGFTSNSHEQIARVCLQAASDDFDLGVKTWVGYLKHMRDPAQANRYGRSYSGSILMDPGEYAHNELIETMSELNMVGNLWMRFLMAVERDAGDSMVASRGNSYYINRLFENSLKAVAKPGSSSNAEKWLEGLRNQWHGLPDYLTKNTQEEAAGTAVGYLALYLIDNFRIRYPKETNEWLKESKMLERQPLFGLAYQLGTHLNRYSSSKITDEERNEARTLARQLLRHEKIPARLRLTLAQSFAQSSRRWILESDDIATDIVDLLIAYDNDTRQVVTPVIGQVLRGLADMKKGPSKEQSALLLKKYDTALFGPLATRFYSGGRGREQFARPMIVLAVRSGDSSTAQRLALVGGESIKGDFQLLLNLAQQGEKDLVSRLIAPPGKLYTNVPTSYTKQIDENWKLLREMVSEEKRYRIDCTIAMAGDSKEWTDASGATREQRLLKLAESFLEKAPKVRMARLQCMGAIATENKAAEALTEEFVKEAQRWMYGQGISGGSTPELSHAQKVILQAMRITAEKGEIAELKRQVSPLLDLGATNNHQAYQAMNMLNRMERTVITSLLKGLARHPDKAEAALPFVNEILEKVLRSQRHSSGYLQYLAVVQSVMVHALAGKGADFDQFIDALPDPQKKKYDSIRKRGTSYTFGRLSNNSSSDWVGEAFNKERATLLAAMLTDAPTRKREVKDADAVFALIKLKTFSNVDLSLALEQVGEERKQFAGRLPLLLNLSDRDKPELVRSLLPDENSPYTGNIAKYTPKLKERMDKLIGIAGDGERFRLECLLARQPSEREYLKETEETPQDRLVKLAKEFSERAPKQGLAREQCLEILTNIAQGLHPLQKEVREISKDWTFGLGSRDNKTLTPREATQRKLLGHAIFFEMAEGNYQRGVDQLKALYALVKDEDEDTSKQALIAANQLGAIVARGYLVSMALKPDPAQLPVAHDLLKEALTLPGKTNQAKQAALSMTILAYALAGQGKEYEELVAIWGKESIESIKATRKDVWIRMFNVIAHPTWNAPEYKEQRKAVLRAMLADVPTAKREIAHLTNLSTLMDGNFTRRPEIYEVVKSLAEDNPRRAEFLTEIAGIMAWRENRVEEAMEIYALAEKEATDRKDEFTLNLNRAYRARCMAQRGKDEAGAWDYASKAVADKLPERDRSWFRKESGKWRKAAKNREEAK